MQEPFVVWLLKTLRASPLTDPAELPLIDSMLGLVEACPPMPPISDCHCPNPDDCLWGGPACLDGEERKRRAHEVSSATGETWTLDGQARIVGAELHK